MPRAGCFGAASEGDNEEEDAGYDFDRMEKFGVAHGHPCLPYPAVPVASSLAGPSPAALTARTVRVTLSPELKPVTSAGGLVKVPRRVPLGAGDAVLG